MVVTDTVVGNLWARWYDAYHGDDPQKAKNVQEMLEKRIKQVLAEKFADNLKYTSDNFNRKEFIKGCTEDIF